MQSTEKGFKPVTVGVAEFGTGARFRIDQIKRSGACRIVNLRKEDDVSYSHSIPNAWANVRYQAKVRQDTERSDDWKGFF